MEGIYKDTPGVYSRTPGDTYVQKVNMEIRRPPRKSPVKVKKQYDIG